MNETPDNHDLVEGLFDSAPTEQNAAPTRRARRRRQLSRAQRSRRLAFGFVGLTAGAVAMSAVAFVGLQSVFPWLGFDSNVDDLPVAALTEKGTRTVSDGSPSPAETVVAEVMATNVPVFNGWDARRKTNTISSPSLGFGCDPKDGLSPVVAETRTWTTDTASVTVSARAYPAGGGAFAVDGIASAAHDCAAAWTGTPGVSVGVEAIHVESARIASLVWRRGDVVMVATVSANGRAGSPSTYSEALTRFDETLAHALANHCVNPEAGVDAARRSPYLSRDQYTGHHVVKRVSRPKTRTRSAEKRATSPVVPIPAEAIPMPYAGERPAAPNPLPTDGPTELPAEVLAPTMPTMPVKPDLNGSVEKAVEDITGPGCGWAFTDQQVPLFDDVLAQANYKKAIKAERKRLLRLWRSWQRAKLNYYDAYDTYRVEAAAYNKYSRKLAKVRDAWAIIESARSDYYTLLAEYQEAVEALAVWREDRATAREEFRDAKEECRLLDEQEEQDIETDDDLMPPPATPTIQCPPLRPAILDETAPIVPPLPKPSAEAQLPAD